MRKKLLFVIPSMRTGGAEKLVLDLATFIDKEKFEVLVLSYGKKTNSIYDNFALKRNINIKYLDKKKGFDVSLIKKVSKTIDEFKPDILSTHINTVPYLLWKTRKIEKKYHTIHNLAEKDAKGFGRILLKIAFRFFKFKPVAICETVKQTISKVYHKSDKKIPCIYNGIDTMSFEKKEKFDDGIIKFISIGRLTKVKNYDFLLDVFHEVLKIHKNITLTILGDGFQRDNLNIKLQQLELCEKIRFLGNVSNVDEYLNLSDVYVTGSKYEGLPLTLLEAMSCGLPIITTKAGGSVDIVKDNENGMLIDIGDKKTFVASIIKIIENDNLRAELGQNSLILSKTFDIRNTVKEYESLFLLN